MQINAATPRDYIASLDEPRKAEIKTLDKLIRTHAPGLKPFTQAGMLAYGPCRYTYASGREGDWMYVALASQKNYISLYVCLTNKGKYLAESYKKLLPKASIGKSCVRFKRLSDVDEKALIKLIKEAGALAKKDQAKKK